VESINLFKFIGPDLRRHYYKLLSIFPEMKKNNISIYLIAAAAIALSLGSCKNWTETGTGSRRIVTNKEGQTLGYDTTSGVKNTDC